ncbi:MAG TPA: hypothetical protein VL854_06955 [Nitrososphaeraceae archaeon]|nr:hypothetical protein [Nitrososphaeraceae archaeon]
MIVKNLIEHLKFFPDDLEVSMWCPNGYIAGIGEVEVNKDRNEVLLISEDIVARRKEKLNKAK